MKHRILSLISKKPNSFWEYFDLVYIGIIGFFILALIYEGVSFLLSYYTFSRMLGALALCSVLYVFSVFQRSPRDIKKITQSYVSHPYVVFAVSRRKELLYGSVIVYLGVFLSGFVVGFGSIFTYATYAVMGVFVVYKILGGKLGRTLRDPGIQQKTFFKILVLSVSIFITCIGVTLDAYEITDHKTLILLVTSLAYVLGFTYVFSDILQNVGVYFHSKKFHTLMIGNTYNFLSIIFIVATLLLLLGKFGVLSGVGDKILSVFVSEKQEIQTPVVVERLAQPSFSEVVESRSVFVTKNISEIFEFDGFSQLGSSGPEVSKLQESLGLLGYYDGELSGDYDEATRDALTRTLIERCDWPETTRGIFGPLAQECLYSLEVQFDAVGLEGEVGNTRLPAIVSDEAEPLGI